MKKLSAFILKTIGWKIVVGVEEPIKSVVCVAPHTSNWDFPLGQLAYWALGRKTCFLIKSSWFIFPLNLFFNAVGGIPVDRSKRTSVTTQMVEQFNKRERFHLAITPEGTRSLNPRWKMGFYHIALNAQVPIQIIYIDYAKKEVGSKAVFFPTGDEKADLEKIQSFYKGVGARFPEKFNVK